MTNTVVLPGHGSHTLNDITPSLDLETAINSLRLEKNAVILAHYYQDARIQGLADFIGDSLDLSRKAVQTEADVIVFCGVRFMAEVAKILSPERKVFLPDANAGCTLEESCKPQELRKFRESNPDHQVVSYINCSAEVKAESDVIVTSSNAELIVRQLPEDRPILFCPDRHLGRYISEKTGRYMTLWPGSCTVHTHFSLPALTQLKAAHPGALVVAHPECPEEILQCADHIGSTRSLLDFVIDTPATEVIVGTEPNIIHQMRKYASNKKFLPVPGTVGETEGVFCPFMALNNMEKLYLCLLNEAPRIEMPDSLIMAARKPLERMLDMSPKSKQRSPK